VRKVRWLFAPIAVALLLGQPASAGAREFEGPGRFCGYSAIVDLLPGEVIETLEGGIHGGTFRWRGAFGTLEVDNIGWARRPRGRAERRQTATGQTLFQERRREGRFVTAIWNRQHGAAYFYSDRRLTPAQREAIERVGLFDELHGDPEACRFRTVFSWGE
jgi:hypothetical protein